ncbi:hypothetical protein [Chitinimonas sp. BJB300]|uniref:hypothetical protein n=1 Tax=Chitinimonas sp. BJB300 TaxID=1559339 RepID=UPI001111DD24|nr:hypothetical protein [Chitinimonas sp. BJB300]TSJ87417.1 hypothetical protein FG002_014410 [Chitinimonas sp. BJB300]
MKKEMTLSALLAAAVMSATPAMAAHDIKAGSHIAKIEAIVDFSDVKLARAQQQQQQQQQQQNILAAATQTGVLLGISNDNGFDA